MNLYIYSLEGFKHVATITGKDYDSMEAKANDCLWMRRIRMDIQLGFWRKG